MDPELKMTVGQFLQELRKQKVPDLAIDKTLKEEYGVNLSELMPLHDFSLGDAITAIAKQRNLHTVALQPGIKKTETKLPYEAVGLPEEARPGDYQGPPLTPQRMAKRVQATAGGPVVLERPSFKVEQLARPAGVVAGAGRTAADLLAIGMTGGKTEGPTAPDISPTTRRTLEFIGSIPGDLEERLGKGLVNNIQTDLSDIIIGLGDLLFKNILPIMPTTDPASWEAQFKAGMEAGGGLGGAPVSAVAHLAAIAEPLAEGDVKKSLQLALARPATTALLVEPFLRGTLKGAASVNPKVAQKVVQTADDIKVALQEKAPFPEARAAAQRAVADPYAQSTRAASASVERTMREARSAQSRLPELEFAAAELEGADVAAATRKFEPGPAAEALPVGVETAPTAFIPPGIVDKVTNEVMARLPKYGEATIDQPVLRIQAQNIITKELLNLAREESPILLRSPEVRTRLIDQILKQDPTLNRVFVRNALEAAAKEMPGVYPEIGRVKGTDIQGMLGKEYAQLAGTKGGKRIMKEVADRTKAGMRDYIFNEVARKLIGDETAVIQTAFDATSQVKNLNFKNPQQVIRLRPDKSMTSEGMKRLWAKFVEELAAQGETATAAKLAKYERPAQVLIDKGIISHDAMINPGMNSSLASLLNITGSATVFNMPLLQGIKRGLTSQNVKAGMNNLRANYVLSILDDGLRLEFIPEVFRFAENPEVAQAFHDAVRRTNIIDNNMLAVEAGGISTTSVPAIDLVWKGIDRITKNLPIGAKARNIARRASELPGLAAKAQDKFYTFGDQHFKLYKTLKEMHDAYKDLQAAKSGENFTIQVGKHVYLGLRKNAKGQFNLVDKAGKVGQELSQRQLYDILAESGARIANNLYVDYFERPTYLTKLANSKLLGITSPFITWAWKTMDIPLPVVGKKGLVGHVLGKEPIISSTDSAGVLRRQSLRDVWRGVRRAAAVEGARQETFDDPKELRRAYAFDKKGVPAVSLMTAYGEPNVMYYNNMSGINPLSSSDLFMRGLTQTLLSGVNQLGKGPVDDLDEILAARSDLTLKEAKELGKEMSEHPKGSLARQIYATQIRGIQGKIASPMDFLRIGQFAGTPISDVVFAAQKAEDNGRTQNFYNKVGKIVANITLGGTATNLFYETTGARPSAKAWGQTKFSPDALDATEQFVKGVMGLGYRAAFQYGKQGKFTYGQAQRFLEDYKKSLRQGISQDMYYKLQEPDLTLQERRAIKKKYFILETIVQKEYKREHDLMKEALTKSGWFNRKIKSRRIRK